MCSCATAKLRCTMSFKVKCKILRWLWMISGDSLTKKCESSQNIWELLQFVEIECEAPIVYFLLKHISEIYLRIYYFLVKLSPNRGLSIMTPGCHVVETQRHGCKMDDWPRSFCSWCKVNMDCFYDISHITYDTSKSFLRNN